MDGAGAERDDARRDVRAGLAERVAASPPTSLGRAPYATPDTRHEVVSLACSEREGYANRPCPNEVAYGDVRCPDHGGSPESRTAARVKRAAKRVLGADMESTGTGSTDVARGDGENGGSYGATGRPRSVDPGAALLEEVHRTAGHVAWLRERVEELEESELVWGKVMQTSEEREVTGHVADDDGAALGSYTLEREEHRAQINVWWDMYTKERDRLTRVAATALKAGVEERRVRMYERSIDMLETIFEGALGDLGIDSSDPRVRRVLATRIRQAIESGNAGVVTGHAVAEPRSGALARGAVVESSAADGW